VPKLVVFRGDAVEKEVRLARKPLRIGRHERNDVVLDDSANGVSRFHAELRPEGSNYFIVDLQSRNGIWLNGRRIKEKAALTPGVSVTIGGFELTLEDDTSSSVFDSPAAPPADVTVAERPQAKREDTGRSSGRVVARPAAVSRPANRRQIVLWSAVGVVLLLVIVGTFAVVRYVTRPPNEPPPIVQAEPQPEPPPPPPPEPVDPNRAIVDQHLAEARVKLDAKNFAGALNDNLLPALELEPENQTGLEMRKEAEAALAALAKPAVPKPAPPAAAPETPGIPRRSDESQAEYAARVIRVQTEFADGKASLEKGEYVTAGNHFRNVQREQPGYQGVDAIITDTQARQRKAVEDAVKNGQTYESLNRKRDARLFYRQALTFDPSATVPRERENILKAQMTAEADKLATQASAAAKLGQVQKAIGLYQQIVDMMLPGDEAKDNAERQLRELKQ
jgi:predicted component of type VI protein secretion system